MGSLAMAIKDLAICYNGSANADSALQYAIQMCKKYDATLTGLFVKSPVRFEGQVERWISDDVLKSVKNAEREVSQAIEARFRDKIAAEEFKGPVDWLFEEGHPNDLLARCARYFDLLLMGQFSDADNAKRQVRAEDIVLRSGKPLIVVPNGYKVHPFKEYAVVAWDGSRPAARALTDAMQILETKKRLDVLTIGETTADSKEQARSGSDIVRHLERHGIDARRIMLSASRNGVGATIVKYCAENDPDVLVMGALGQARLREDLFGSLTRHILRHMSVPVMMAH
jgi:nucleotide-binding universal stress UspA family protein